MSFIIPLRNRIARTIGRKTNTGRVNQILGAPDEMETLIIREREIEDDISEMKSALPISMPNVISQSNPISAQECLIERVRVEAALSMMCTDYEALCDVKDAISLKTLTDKGKRDA